MTRASRFRWAWTSSTSPSRTTRTALKAAGVPVVYTGPVDRYFGYELGDLKWRTVDFKEVRYDEGDHFGCPVMNFSDADVPYTRAIEFKNFNPERRDAGRTRTRRWCGRSTAVSPSAATSRITRSTPTRTRHCTPSTRPRPRPSRTPCSAVAWARTSTTTCTNVIDTALTAYEEQVAPLLKK